MFQLPRWEVHVDCPTLDTRIQMHTPTVPLRLLAEAAFELAFNPNERLSVDPKLEPYITDSPGSHMLKDIICQSIQGPRAVPLPKFKTTIGQLDTCAAVEELFFTALKNGMNPTSSQSLRVVTSESGRPLLVQKNANSDSHSIVRVPSALTLEDLTIGNITWPAGQIVQVYTPHRVKSGERLTVITHDQVTALGVIRPSAFALEPAERHVFGAHPSDTLAGQTGSELFGLEPKQGKDQFYDFISKATMADIRHQVNLILGSNYR